MYIAIRSTNAGILRFIKIRLLFTPDQPNWLFDYWIGNLASFLWIGYFNQEIGYTRIYQYICLIDQS